MKRKYIMNIEEIEEIAEFFEELEDTRKIVFKNEWFLRYSSMISVLVYLYFASQYFTSINSVLIAFVISFILAIVTHQLLLISSYNTKLGDILIKVFYVVFAYLTNLIQIALDRLKVPFSKCKFIAVSTMSFITIQVFNITFCYLVLPLLAKVSQLFN